MKETILCPYIVLYNISFTNFYRQGLQEKLGNGGHEQGQQLIRLADLGKSKIKILFLLAGTLQLQKWKGDVIEI